MVCSLVSRERERWMGQDQDRVRTGKKTGGATAFK